MKLEDQKIKELEKLFSDGYGMDSDKRKNAELQLQTILSRLQLRTAKQLNMITIILAVISFLHVILLTIQIFRVN